MALIKIGTNGLDTGVGGKVLQVISSQNNYAMTTTSTSPTDILSASAVTWETTITPSSTSSKIIISANINFRAVINGQPDARSGLNILYKIGAGSYSSLSNDQEHSVYDYGGSGVSFFDTVTFLYLITPSTTSAITVKFTCKSVQGYTSTYINNNSSNSNCILYEVSA